MRRFGNEVDGEGVPRKFRRGGWGDRVLCAMGLFDVLAYLVMGVWLLARFIVSLLKWHS